MITRRSLFVAGGSALALAGCETAQVTADGRFPIMDVLGIVPEVSDFRSALRRADLADLLNSPGPFTVFAPTNLAWGGAPASFRDGGAASLRNLIAGGRLGLRDIQARGGRVRMLSGIDIRVVGGTPTEPRIQAARAGAAPSGASASVVRPNILCSNGFIHVIGGVLIPA
ncbi:fasciclin domain-containing protein [Roseomonas fluvialis]|uniref:fasciclin domain-containing protein n=1 Tax=Roseomonas fluvialis TaxID=1750527 RepID=UPI001FCD5D80|nr:fasciclin domain-containing protein [Roseomonas fluvialis]